MKTENKDYSLYAVMSSIYLFSRDLEEMAAEEIRTLSREDDVCILNIKSKAMAILMAVATVESIQEDEKKPAVEN